MPLVEVGGVLPPLVVLLLASPSIHGYPDNGDNKVLFPSIDEKLAIKAIPEANATCGENGPESFCKLVEHVYMRGPHCDICDAYHPLKRHPIEHAADGLNTSWQSPSLANGFQYEWVTITLDLRQRYQVAYVIVQCGIAPRPGNWILERSLDKITWKPWQYFAINDAECEHFYGIPASQENPPRFRADDDVICTSFHSKLDPLEEGEIFVSLVNGRPGATNSTQELQEFTTARYVRLRFQKLQTLNADIWVIREKNHQQTIDQSVTRRYFYSIRDIQIGGQCICYGHADTCEPDPGSGQSLCACKHNTCGESCKECCPLFRQQPWRPGTVENPNVCDQCQCFNHAHECRYDPEVAKQKLSMNYNGIFEGGGVCVDCQHNTEGYNCERCKDGFYRRGASAYDPYGCRPCECDPTGAVDNCVKDENSATGSLQAGDCVCKPGFGGRACDRCALGFRNHPVCEPCPCNKHGSANYATCEQTCICKQNVEGEFCDRCKLGTFNLDENNPLGCTPCFCSGVTSECKELDWEKGKIQNLRGWRLTGLDAKQNVTPSEETDSALFFDSRKISDRSLYFWKAPSSYRGNLLTSYGGYLKYFVYFVPEAQGPEVPLPDVILKGNGLSIEHQGRHHMMPRENVSINVHFHEAASWYRSDTREAVSKTELMRVLADVDTFLVKAHYNHYQLQASIFGVALDRAEQDSESDVKLPSVEQCSCPANYDGLSCESCIPGYRRVNNQILNGQCQACSCSGHSMRCDPFTGFCLDCQENTAGTKCEVCAPGFYGNPLLSEEEGGKCRPCKCPLENPENNFSPTCTLSSFGLSISSEYICTACLAGYIGNHCEMCADGFFGDPKALNGSCRACECNENIDPAAVGNCDPSSGRCLKCIGNTEGFNCERCKSAHWGSALAHNCRFCDCNVHGAASKQCDNSTGLCECKEGYVGRHCERCKDGHGDIENGCPACRCNETGAYGRQCDQVSGQCQCKPGMFGKQCDQCRKGYYNFTETGCTFCGCYEPGSVEGGICDAKDGSCMCKPNVIGRTCSACAEGFFNVTSGVGCQACKCHELGASKLSCEPRFGYCTCKSGVTGDKCDRCLPGYFGLSAEGCSKCPLCPAPGHVCDPDTGACTCPPLTKGAMCESCEENAWEHHPLKGCKPCGCESQGSVSSSCDLFSGQCTCREGYSGLRCEQCRHGSFNFPECEKCRCYKPGTKPSACSAEHGCGCDEAGQCPCKSQIEGKKCRECKPNSFSLDAENPAGCTTCFCFNRTDFCIQSAYVWQQIAGDDRTAVFQQPWVYYERIVVLGLRVFPEEPARIHSYPTDNEPIYWSLPRRYLGDKTLSYNGFLRFTVTNTDRNSLSGMVHPDRHLFQRYPLVVIVGNHRIVLEYYAEQLSNDGAYSVRFREDLWTIRNSREIPVSRQMLMVALQNLQAVYVRGTFIYGPTEARLSDISLDIAVWDNSTSTNNTAIGVEQCVDCPEKYSGLSCQNPAEGYCRKKLANYLDSANDLDLIGWAEACACNGHSNQCDRETCLCTNCQHNTEGNYCELCSRGFYGNAKLGTPTDCKPCACPQEDNSFSDTCQPVNYGRGYICDACKPGYGGQYCETCLDGYYGDPTAPGGKCERCNCNPDGSLHGYCNRVTGECECIAGVTGRDCSECHARHALINRVCTSCDQGCYKDLMLDIDAMEANYASYNFTGLVPAPWGKINATERQVEDIGARLKSTVAARENATKLLEELNSGKYRAKEEAASVLLQATDTQKLANGSSERIAKTNENATALLAEFEDTLRKSMKSVAQLERSGVTDSNGQKQVHPSAEQWITEATILLNRMRHTSFLLDKRLSRADAELRNSEGFVVDNFMKAKNASLEALGHRLGNLTENLDDLRNRLWDASRKRTDQARTLCEINQKMAVQFEKIIDEANNVNSAAKAEHEEATKKIEEMKQMLLDTHDIYSEVNSSLISQLENATEQCEMRSSQFQLKLPEYERNYKLAAEHHAHQLTVAAEGIKASFRDTKFKAEAGVSASQAYEQIAKGLDDAMTSAEGADEASKNTEAKLSEQKSVIVIAKNSQTASEALLDEARKLSSQELGDKRKKFEDGFSEMNEKLNSQKKLHDSMKSSYTGFDETHNHVAQIKKKVDGAKSRAIQTQTAITTAHTSVKELDNRISELKAFTGKGISNLTAEVMKSIKDAKQAQERLETVRAQAAANDGKIAEFAGKLALLKEKIRETREKATKIKLAVKSNQGQSCLRLFKPTLSGRSVTNDISLKFRPTPDVRDSLIFMIRTPHRKSGDEYMALELFERRVKFLWNVGDQEESLVNTKRIDAVLKEEKAWYFISIKRINNYAELNVSRIEDARQTGLVTVSHGDRTLARVFNYDTRKSVASFGTQAQHKPKKLDTAEFHGTIGELRIDDVDVPLWNFFTDEAARTGDFCGAATAAESAPSVSETRLAKSFMFRDGYVQIGYATQQIPYKAKESRIQITFSTYSENGLLYFRGDPANKDFIALELYNGHVRFQFFLGGNSKFSAQSEYKYNDGKFYSVLASRDEKNGYLNVETEEVIKPIEGDMKDLNVREADHFIGGIPESFTTNNWKSYDIQWCGFHGCVLTVKWADVELRLGAADKSLNLDKDGCNIKDDALMTSERIVQFQGDGFLVVNGFEFGEQSSVAVNFRTSEPHGVILYQSSRVTTRRKSRRSQNAVAAKGFVSIFLLDSKLFARAGLDQNLYVALTSSGSYNDELTHSILLTRVGREVTLFVDGHKVSSAELPTDETIGSMSADLLLGGIGTRQAPEAEIDLSDSDLGFTGCISDLFFNYRRSPLTPLDLKGVRFGRCTLLEDMDKKIDVMVRCSEDPSFAGSNIHTNPVQRDLALSTEVSNSIEIGSGISTEVTSSYESAARETAFLNAATTSFAKQSHGCSVPASLHTEPNTTAQYGLFGTNSFTRIHLRGDFKSTGRRRRTKDTSESPSEPSTKRDSFDVKNFTMSFNFRTHVADGVMLFWVSNKNEQWINASLVQGRFVLGLHKNKTDLTLKAGKQLNDGVWHRVSISMKASRKKSANFIQIKVDELKPLTSKSRLPKSMRLKQLFVGGAPELRMQKLSWGSRGFQGCIGGFLLNSRKPKDLMKKSQNVSACFSSVLPAAFLTRNGFFRYDNARSGVVSVQLQFRTTDPIGKLLVIADPNDPTDSASLVVEVINGQVQVTVSDGDSVGDDPVQLTSVNPLKICDARWHQLRIDLSDRLLTLKIDEALLEAQIKSAAISLNQLNTLPMFIGGVSADLSDAFAWEKPKNFQGCMRNLQLNNKPVDFADEDMESFGVLSSACPAE